VHSLKDDTENFNFGFFFDHTTGMPIIPGSTIKGILSSLFGCNKNDKYKEQKAELICSLLGKKSLDVEALYNNIFKGEGINTQYKRDIFYDAVITCTKNGLLQDDYITPHGDNPFSNPVPNKMLKVAPEVTFRFSFDLHDFIDKNGNEVSADEKEELFLQLLLWHGVGAKTNVGYGQFEDVDLEKFKANKALRQEFVSESKVDKIFKEFDNNMANIVSSYSQGLAERVKDFKEEFKIEVLRLLNQELQVAKKKKKDKIEERIKKVEAW
jgi:CRISPR-associated protein Cmr6